MYAWENYALRQFPGVWEWMETQIEAGMLVMTGVAFDEVDNKAPDCGKWLKGKNLKLLEANNDILNEAMRIRGLLSIAGDKYHAKGVGENDLLIIDTARVYTVELVSDEERQTNLPQVLSKRKIPAVCSLDDVGISCINFLDYIKRSGTIF